jgi:LCP family protein required for cell wall assembly
LIIAATVGGAAWSFINHLQGKPLPVSLPNWFSAQKVNDISRAENREKTGEEISGDSLRQTVETAVEPLKGTVNVLLVGLDDVDNTQRADAIALATFNQESGFVGMMAIPRDSRVQIPGHGWDKINHAYVFGGIDLLKKTVMNLLNVGIDYFVIVNYDGFARIVDLLGGLDIDVEKRLVYTDYSAKLFINIPKGFQHMTGKTVLEYARFRHDPLGDIGRVQRQQRVMGLLMEKMKSPSIIWKISGIIEEAVASLNSDLTPLEALRLANFAVSLPRERVELIMTPGRASYIDTVSYWIVDVPAASLIWARWVDGGALPLPFPDDSLSMDIALISDQSDIQSLLTRIGKIGILNGDGASGLGKQASQAFQKLGVDVGFTGNARHFDYHTSNVVYPENATENDKNAAEALAQLCGITNRALIQSDRTVTMVSVILGHDKESIFRRLQDISF